MPKSDLYAVMVRRLDDAIDGGHFLEASWYSYALIEDRLLSMLRSSSTAKKPRMMMGKKIGALNDLALTNAVVAANFESIRLDAWAKSRNNLMHAMAEGSMTIENIDAEAKSLAIEGRNLVRVYAAAARRLKSRLARTR